MSRLWSALIGSGRLWEIIFVFFSLKDISWYNGDMEIGLGWGLSPNPFAIWLCFQIILILFSQDNIQIINHTLEL